MDMDLFEYMHENATQTKAPLASRMRPTTLNEVVGQSHIIGKDKLLYRAIAADQLRSVIFYGPPGTGKTMLSILIGLSACKQEVPVKFFRTAGLINQFSESQSKGNLSALKKKLNSAQIIILDEFGYVPYDRTGAQLLFDYLSEIHEQKSVILNTNLEFSQWVNVLYDQRMTTALIGRLTHHVELILFPGINNRLRESSINETLARISNQEASNG